MANNTGKNAQSSASPGTAEGTRTAAATESKSTDTAGTYTVKAGDSLESIAAENGTTPAELMKLNPQAARAGNNFVYEGDTLRLK